MKKGRIIIWIEKGQVATVFVDKPKTADVIVVDTDHNRSWPLEASHTKGFSSDSHVLLLMAEAGRSGALSQMLRGPLAVKKRKP